MARFGNVTNEEELELLVEQRHSKSTKSVFKVSEKLLTDYTEIDTEYSIQDLFNEHVVSVTDLDIYLRRFFVNARKRDGDTYCRKSMLTIRFGLQKLLKKKRDVDIINDDRFGKSRDAFKAVLVKLKKDGKGDSKHKDIISDADIEKLYESECMSIATPETLLNKVFFDYMLHFCNRGRENLRTLRKDDFSIHIDAEGRKYVTIKTMLTKNRREDDDDSTGSNRIYEDKGNLRCPVASLELYLSKLHPENDDFFQRPAGNKLRCEETSPWYTKQSLGHNKLGKMMPEMSKHAQLSKVYTNHCVRATCITLLDKNGFESRHIIGISKHKSESSLKHYSSRLSDEKRIAASSILTSACNGNRGNNLPANEVQMIDNNIRPVERDQQLLDFMTPSQEDYLYASLADTSDFDMDISHVQNTPTATGDRQTPCTSHSQSFSTGNSCNMPITGNTTANHLGVYAPFNQENVVPLNLINYGTVNINYSK